MFCDYGLLIGLNLNRHWRPTRGNQKMSQSVHVRVLPFLTCPRCSSPGGKGESRWRKRLYRGRPLPPVGDPHRKNNQNNNKDTKNTQTNKSRINVYGTHVQTKYVRETSDGTRTSPHLFEITLEWNFSFVRAQVNWTKYSNIWWDPTKSSSMWYHTEVCNTLFKFTCAGNKIWFHSSVMHTRCFNSPWPNSLLMAIK